MESASDWPLASSKQNQTAASDDGSDTSGQRVRQDGPLYSHHSQEAASSTSSSASRSSKYPSVEEIHALFSNLSGNPSAFFDRVSPKVDWTVMGTHPCAGRYTSLQDFQTSTLERLGKIMQAPGIQLMPRNVIGGGEQEWCTVELVVNAICKNGLVFDNCYAWCCRFDDHGIIVEVRAYLDSWLVRQAIVENEAPSHRAEVPRVDDV
ncbi:Putative NTF2-like domain superfamily protein [Septoria linicola]|uniref:NTF2-like domain superfamily protein n=1 Tax=Septoria linicola TaxID=215465 RepID=A0A9Q9AQZ6_9PEZI|nr:putative NTF2-like domain superfamily protein [Septoria linicola]USW50593.1 Putative NTF2-like domain superfamily protein [Septoria linicola]